jgi:hypothetical protein
MAGALTPAVGDFVGIRNSDGEWMYVNAVNRTTREIKIAPFGGSISPWLTEVQALAQYSYLWGTKKSPPFALFARTDDEPTQPGFAPAAPAKCECGSGSDALSGAHSHWCRRYLAP